MRRQVFGVDIIELLIQVCHGNPVSLKLSELTNAPQTLRCLDFRLDFEYEYIFPSHIIYSTKTSYLLARLVASIIDWVHQEVSRL